MKHQITQTENDYLIFHLYDASTNPSKRKARRRGHIIITLASFPFIFQGYRNGYDFTFYLGIAWFVLAALFGHMYFKWVAKRHYTNHVRDAYKKLTDEKIEIEILDEVISTVEKTGSSTVKISEIGVVIEIANHYLIRLTTGPTLIVPKINTALNEEILAMIERHKIDHVAQLDWKW
jgi:hypothetical protein